MLTTLVAKYIVEIAILLTLFVGSSIVKVYRMLTQQKQRQKQLEQELYGKELNPSDDGFVDETQSRMEKIENNVEDIKENQTEIRTNVQHITKTVDRIYSSQNQNQAKNNKRSSNNDES